MVKIKKAISKFYSLYIYIGKIGLLICRGRKYIHTHQVVSETNLSIDKKRS